MRKDLKEGNVTVSHSMPNLTNIYRIGREAVKLNTVVDEDIRMRETCTVLWVNRKTVPINSLHAA